MSIKLMQLIGNYTIDVRQEKDHLKIIDLKENLYTEINSLFSLQGVGKRSEQLCEHAYEKMGCWMQDNGKKCTPFPENSGC